MPHTVNPKDGPKLHGTVGIGPYILLLDALWLFLCPSDVQSVESLRDMINEYQF